MVVFELSPEDVLTFDVEGIRSADEWMYYIDRSVSEGITDAAQNLALLKLPFQ
jgi:hypothetical protein